MAPSPRSRAAQAARQQSATPTPAAVRAQALACLARREHSRLELRARLLRWLQARRRAQHDANNGLDSLDGLDDPHSPHSLRSPDSPNGCGLDEPISAVAEALDAAAIDAAADAVDRVDRDAQLVDAVLDQLTAAGHLSDDRFAESRIHARQARFGNRRIVAELREHGLLVPDAQRLALRDTEFARARQVLLTRFGGRVQSVLRLAESSSPVTRDDTARERARMQRFLLSRGFSPDVVRAAVASLAASADDDADTDDG